MPPRRSVPNAAIIPLRLLPTAFGESQQRSFPGTAPSTCPTLEKVSRQHLRKRLNCCSDRWRTEEWEELRWEGGDRRQSLESLGSQLILVYSHVIQLQMSALWVVNGPTGFYRCTQVMYELLPTYDTLCFTH